MKVRFGQDGALGTVTLDSPPLNQIGTEDARGGIQTFLESGPRKATFAGR